MLNMYLKNYNQAKNVKCVEKKVDHVLKTDEKFDHVYRNVNESFEYWTRIWKSLIKHLKNVNCVYKNSDHVIKNVNILF